MLDRLSALVALCLALSITPIAAQDTDPFMRHPAVHPDGDRIAFSYQGDLWTVSTDGGTPERLTIHEAYEGQPRWGPEGNRVAFTSDRFGNSDLYAMDAAGSTPDRLTYHSTGDVITAVDGRPVADAPNFYQLLEGTIEEKILLDVTDPEGEERTVRIRPTGDLEQNHEQFRGHYPFGERLPYAAWTKPVDTSIPPHLQTSTLLEPDAPLAVEGD
ncbi:MAG: hypothetical protein BRD39_01520 [Bacteroidetes bacterium QH_9_64_21]|nr:MAG: hypothetical protein BRD39_01520 [Bacteroidetes bacterium QH_9_64_21]